MVCFLLKFRRCDEKEKCTGEVNSSKEVIAQKKKGPRKTTDIEAKKKGKRKRQMRRKKLKKRKRKLRMRKRN